MKKLQAPFPYFGGKSSIANIVWKALGQPRHYIEPFFGSGAVLLNRPNYDQSQHVETVNDKDGFICNVWRALQFAPDEVAKWCDWPVNHADLCARRMALLANEQMLLENLIADDKWYDPIMAGYWIWAASCWIGSGLTRPNAIPNIAGTGIGIHKIGQIPDIAKAGIGIHKIGKRPNISQAGIGIHKIGQRPDIAQYGVTIHSLSNRVESNKIIGVTEPYNNNIYTWFRELSERLRYVRVVCGDWKQVCGGNWQTLIGTCGMFFDPPYGIEDRDKKLYHHDGINIAKEVNEWCLERGNDPNMRIVIAGYEEHENLLEHGWRKQNWKAQGGYGNIGNGKGKANRKREALYFSPYCNQISLLDV